MSGLNERYFDDDEQLTIMNENLRKQFEMSAKQYNASRLKRVVFSPWRTLYPEAIEVMSKYWGTTIPVYTNTFFGRKMKVVLPEPVSTSIWRFGLFEENLTAFMLNYLKPGMVFYDIGAHFGFFSLLASHMVGNSGQVHAFEPTRSTFDMLKENTKDIKNIFVNQNAMWSQSASIPFNDFGIAYSAFNSAYDPRFNDSDKRNAKADKYEVRAISIDEHAESVGRFPDFIKIDAESAEQEILKGMERTFERTKPMIALEVGDWAITNVASSQDLVKNLLNRGYEALEFYNGTIRPHILRDKYEYNNILFIPSKA